MSHKAYIIAVNIIGYIVSLAAVILQMLGIIHTSWIALFIPLILSAAFSGIVYDDYVKALDEDETIQQLTITCNQEINAQLISEILNADAQGKIFGIDEMEIDETEDDEKNHKEGK